MTKRTTGAAQAAPSGQWVTLPIELNEGPVGRAARAVLEMGDGDTCIVRDAASGEREAELVRHGGVWYRDPETGEAIDVAAVWVPEPRSRSGPSLTAAERRANGLALLQGLWLPAELVACVDRECERRGLRRTALVRTALEEWLASAR